MAYIYEIKSQDVDLTLSSYLYHKESFSQEQFDSLVIEASINAVKLCKAKGHSTHNFEDIIWLVENWLIDKKGFWKVEYKASWSSEAFCMFRFEYPGVRADNQDVKLGKALRDAGYTEKDDTFLHRIADDG